MPTFPGKIGILFIFSTKTCIMGPHENGFYWSPTDYVLSRKRRKLTKFYLNNVGFMWLLYTTRKHYY